MPMAPKEIGLMATRTELDERDRRNNLTIPDGRRSFLIAVWLLSGVAKRHIRANTLPQIGKRKTVMYCPN